MLQIFIVFNEGSCPGIFAWLTGISKQSGNLQGYAP